jgi:hypothetical protein
VTAPASTGRALAELPACDGQGRPFGRGLASAAARLQLAARAEIHEALASRKLAGRRRAFPAPRATQLARAFGLLAAGGPFIADGQRIEDRSELLYVSSDVDRAIRKLRMALADLPEPAAQHIRCALAFAAGALAIREAASPIENHPRKRAAT